MKITEIVTPDCMADKPKAIISTTIERRLHSFDSLEELARFSRRHFYFVHTQDSSDKAGRTRKICEKLHLGSHLLWLDLDINVDVKDLKKRFQTSNLKGFFYYTSSFYSKGESRVRICIVTKEQVLVDGQAEFYARQALHKLGYDSDFINNSIDRTIYRPTSYFAPVMDKDGTLIADYDQKGQSLFIFEDGQPFEWTRQENYQKERVKPNHDKSLNQVAQFGVFGEFAARLMTLKNISEAIARSNGTVTIVFEKINEKTKGGYYLNPEVDPWVVFHPNKGDKTPFYINKKLGKKDFAKYKKYVLKHFLARDVLKDLTEPDKEINTDKPYLSWKVFRKDKPLLLIESPTGSGKTTAMAKWLKKFEGSVLFISVNRAQAVTTHRSLLKQGLTDFHCYIASDREQEQKNVDGRYYLSSFVRMTRDGYAPKKVICGAVSYTHLRAHET